jgi:hypothetical protein
MSVMKSCISIIAVSLLMSSPVLAANMVVATADMTLTEAAQAKFNRDTRPGDRHFVPVAGNAEPTPQLYAAAGLTPEQGQGWTLEQLHVAKINREGGSENMQLAPASVSRAYGRAGTDTSHLARSIGLDPAEAADMSVWEVTAAKLKFEH